MSKPFVAILMGADSDLPSMQATLETLAKLRVPYEVKLTSAHLTPVPTRDYVTEADQRGSAAFIGAAGLAAHLCGVVAALTIKPVIAVPMESGPLRGQDALLSIIMMPGGIPVATVAIGRTGTINGAYLAAQILALSDPELAERLHQERADNAAAVIAKDAEVQIKHGNT